MNERTARFIAAQCDQSGNEREVEKYLALAAARKNERKAA